MNRQVHLKNVYNLKNQIKFVLNLGKQSKNDTIEKYIEETFNVHNPDPEYVFLLPGSTNTTLVFHRSNFTDISFPNTTSIQAMYNLLKKSKLSHERIPKQFLSDQRFFAKYEDFMSSENDLHEAESLKVIQENVRTEKSFLKFMEKLNKDTDSITVEANSEPYELFKQQTTNYPTLIRNIHAEEHIGNYELSKDSKYEKSPTNENISWDDLGLTGWIGTLNKHHENPEENG